MSQGQRVTAYLCQCAPGRAHSLGGESPLHTRQGEVTGFGPGRSAHQAVAQAQQYIAEGYGWVVDLDLKKFFDRVHNDRLMARMAQRISDKRVCN
jgi:Reverse transcriptase (RNA-dependent DNA polymerase)